MTYKSFMTTLMAGVIAITGFAAAPAKADNTAEIIAGVATLAIIGAAIASSNRNDRYVTRYNTYNHGHRHNYGHRRHYHNNHYILHNQRKCHHYNTGWHHNR